MTLTQRSIFTSLSALALSLTLASTASAQLINGNFETNDLTGWTTFVTANGTTGVGLPDVTPFDTTGSGVSPAAHFQVGEVIFDSTLQGGGIFQSVTVASPGVLTVSADIASLGNPVGNGSGGVFELFVNGGLLDTVDFGSIASSAIERDTLGGAVAVVAGPVEIRIQIRRPFTIGTGNVPHEFVDNVVLSGVSFGGGATAPEPGTLGLLMGGLAFGALRRRRRA